MVVAIQYLAVPPYPKVRTKKLNPKFIVPKADPRDKRETHRTIAIELDSDTKKGPRGYRL